MTRAVPTVATIVAAMIVMGLVACDHAARPSPVPNPGPAEPAALQIRLKGLVVDGSDRPVAGAEVAVVDDRSPQQPLTVTDATGAYTLAFSPKMNGVAVNVRKVGFEPSRLYEFWEIPLAANEVVRNLRLHQVLRINAGESVALTIGPGDPACEYGGNEWNCRRVRIVAPIAGRLTIEVPNGGFTEPYFQMNLPDRPGEHVPISVGAGSETIVEVLLVGGGMNARTTTLTTRLESSS